MIGESNKVEAVLTDTLVSGQFYIRTPSQNSVFLNAHMQTTSVFLHFLKRPVPVTDTFFASLGCPLTRAFTVVYFGVSKTLTSKMRLTANSVIIKKMSLIGMKA